MRLPEGGRLIDRSHAVSFTFDGKPYKGHPGDTLASALLANGVKLVGRSFKYHRPRGIVTSGPEEPNALVNLGSGPTHEPNIRMTQVELRDGLEAESQNRWPSLDFDMGAMNSWASRIFPAGFYYKTFKQPRHAWKYVFEPIIRRAAGLGAAPTQPDDCEYEHFYAFCDVLVAGGGVAGLVAARVAAEAGAKVLLVEQTERLGGRLLIDDDAEIDGKPAADWLSEQIAALEAMDNVTIRTRTCCSSSNDHNYVLLYERCGDRGEAMGPRHRLWRVRTRQLVAATGMIERPIAFHYNDTPGVMLASAVRDYVKLWGVAPGERTVVTTTNDDGYRTALALVAAGKGATVLDSRDDPSGDLIAQAHQAGVRILPGTGIGAVEGGKHGISAIKVVALASPDSEGARIECDCVAMAGGWSPVVHLWSHAGGKVRWDSARAMYRPDVSPLGRDGEAMVVAVGGASGALTTGEVIADVYEKMAASFETLAMLAPQDERSRPHPEEGQRPVSKYMSEAPIQPLWFTPAPGKNGGGNKHFLDFQNDVTAADVALAAREGYESVEHAKRYTTLGMATDQGKLSNINGHAILGEALGKTIDQVGTTTFRPPYTPISMGSIAGRETGPLFKLVRRTALHDWHEANGAEWEPVGDWRRPYRYQHGDEHRDTSIRRECLRVRESVGLLDASTLGKIVVKGPDAGAFLNLMYTNMMSSLRPGRCRYGLMNNDNGFLRDDGVVARLDEETFLCHTTSGGADSTHAWFEEWLQTEWFDLKVYTANITEQYTQIAVAGPKARDVLEGVDSDIDFAVLAFMGFAEGEVAGCPVRVFRISFTGEMSFEFATPSSYGRALWDRLMEVGKPFDIGPYGTEAQHILRAEKGFVVIGDETDGTVTAHDVGMSWAVSKKKDDFIGKRAMERPDLTRPDRKQLVGLSTEDPQQVLPDGAHAVENGRAIGHVTSTYWSPTLKRSIAMALIQGGRNRFGEVLTISTGPKREARAVVCDPVFYDKSGERQNA